MSRIDTARGVEGADALKTSPDGAPEANRLFHLAPGLRTRLLAFALLAGGGLAACGGEESGSDHVPAVDASVPDEPKEFEDPGVPANLDENAGPALEQTNEIVEIAGRWNEVSGCKIEFLDNDLYVQKLYLDPVTEKGYVVYWMNGGGEFGVADLGRLTQTQEELSEITYQSDGRIEGGVHVSVLRFGEIYAVTEIPRGPNSPVALNNLGRGRGFVVQLKGESENGQAYSLGVQDDPNGSHNDRMGIKVGYGETSSALAAFDAGVRAEVGLPLRDLAL